MTIDKSALRAAILRQLQADLALQTRAAQLARDEATSEESRAENKYDTRGQEAAYLAEGQARLAVEIEASIAAYSVLPLPVFGAGDRLALGAVVRLGDPPRDSWYFVGPHAGGLELNLGEKKILVITPLSPLGRQLLGKQVGDAVQAPGRGAAVSLRIAEII
jgi:transcription elongation GreA/GreB family factor